jgi:hypothetical protein
LEVFETPGESKPARIGGVFDVAAERGDGEVDVTSRRSVGQFSTTEGSEYIEFILR